MNKKYIKIGTLAILSLVAIYFAIFAIQNYTLTNSFSRETNTTFDDDTQFTRCNLNILEPEFAFISGIGGGMVSFENSKKLFYQTEEEWDENHTGVTTIKNTTFPELLKMVKEDCSQFQDSGSVGIQETSIQWTYSRAQTEEEKQKEKELNKLTPEQEARLEKEKEEYKKAREGLTEEEIKELDEEENRKALEEMGVTIIE